MDPVSLTLAEAGFSLAESILESADGGGAAAAPAADARGELAELIRSSVSRFEAAAGDAGRSGFGEEEREPLELLVSRARNLSAITEMDRPDQALQYAWTLRESVDYASNRLDEGKLQWLGPFLAGGSLFLAALRYAGEQAQEETARFRQAVLDARYRILDQAVPRLVSQGKRIPWPEISAFLNATGAEGLRGLLQTDPGAGDADEAPSSSTAGPDVLELVTKNLVPSGKIFIFPDIPTDKLIAAEKKLTAPADPEDQLLALVDITVFGGAKDGFAIFGSYFTYATIGQEAMRVDYDHLPSMISASGTKVVIGRQELNAFDEEAAIAIAAFLRDVREAWPKQGAGRTV
ncbi:MAG TPA: hypothetical protein VFT45_18960 [Longimicrobium sp.]|nr:hypothetical protein [Longimicrobium sp.]